MKHATLLLFFVLLFSAVFAQQGAVPEIGVLSGKVIDNATQEPVPYATITIKSVADSSVITGGITDDKGNFVIDKIKLGEHYAEVSMIGYGNTVIGPYNFSRQAKVMYTIGNVVVSANATDLKEVVVEGIGAAVRYEVDRKVYDASKIKTAEGGNAKDVLEQIPSVTVDDQGNIQLRGSQNVRVLVNGRPSSFSLQTLLEQTPQKSIQDVEIITNPSAKYDAEGEAGIINIVMKTNSIEGFTGGFNGNYGTENKFNLGASGGLKTKKWNLTANYNINRFEDDFFRDNLKIANGSVLEQITDEDREFVRNSHAAKIGVDHYFDDKNTLFLSGSLTPGSGSNSSNNVNDNVFTRVINPVSGATLLAPANYDYTRKATGNNDRTGYEVTAGFQHDFKGNPRHNLLLDLSHNVGNVKQFNGYNSIFDALSYTDSDLNDDESTTTVLSTDYTNPFDGKQKLELGYKSTLEDKDQIFDVRFNDMVNSKAGGVLDFDQNVHAGYFTYEKTVGKWALKGGLRGEYTDVKSIATGGSIAKYEDDYFKLFPSASARFNFSETSSFGGNYSRRITRPRSRQLTPFADRTDPNNSFVGNNTLRPETTDSYEVNYNKNWNAVSWEAAIFRRNTNDHIRFSREAGNDGRSTITFKNIATMKATGAETSFNIRPANWVSFNISGNYNYMAIENDNQDSDIRTLSTSIFSSKFMGNFRFGKGWGSQLSADYQAPFRYYIGHLAGKGGININVNKGGLFKGKGSMYLSARDIFNTNGLRVDFEDDYQVQEMKLDWPSQMAFIGFNYNFGNLKKPGKRKMKRRDENDNDQPSIGLGS